MLYAIYADLLVILHFLFILFVVFGGLLSFHNLQWALLHGPALLWGIFVELSGTICPLTPFENILRGKSSGQGYENGFIEHYLLPVIYPDGLTRNIQIVLGISLIGWNLFVYSAVLIMKFKKNNRR